MLVKQPRKLGKVLGDDDVRIEVDQFLEPVRIEKMGKEVWLHRGIELENCVLKAEPRQLRNIERVDRSQVELLALGLKMAIDPVHQEHKKRTTWMVS